LGRRHYNHMYCLGYLRDGHILDSSHRFFPLDPSARCLMCRRWNRLEISQWRSSADTERISWCSISALIHCCCLLVRCLLDQLCRGLQRQDALRYTETQNLHRHVYRHLRTNRSRSVPGRRSLFRSATSCPVDGRIRELWCRWPTRASTGASRRFWQVLVSASRAQLDSSKTKPRISLIVPVD
jgi:hypothetical protein